MFRRRPRRRPLRPHPVPPPPGPSPLLLAARARRQLEHAHRLLAEGRPAEAADIFARVADEAHKHRLPVRAADLALQAARAYLAADMVEAALARGKGALELFIASGRPWRVPRVLPRMVAALREKGYDAEADVLQRQVGERLGQAGLSIEDLERRVTPSAPPRRGTLPAKCSACGGGLVADEVEWHDATTAECPYCGTLVKAT